MSDIYCIDMESLGTTDDAVILSFGAAVFKEEWLEELVNDMSQAKFHELFLRMTSNGLHVKFDVKEQVVKHKRRVQESTVQWWKRQGAEAFVVTKPSTSDISTSELIDRLSLWFVDMKRPTKGKNHVFSRGMIDGRWYQSLLADLGIDAGSKDSPIRWWDFRDVRTTVDELFQQESNGYVPKKYKHLVDFGDVNVKHNALHDAAADCLNIVLARIMAWS